MRFASDACCPRFRPEGARQSPRRAFTLIELLVVIAVLMLLLALTAPSLHRARAKAAEVRCLSNLRSLAAGSASYSTEDARSVILPVHPTADENTTYDDGFFDYGGASGSDRAWGGGRVGPSSDRAARTRPLNKYLGVADGADAAFEVFRCHSDERYDPPVMYDEDWSVWEDVLRARSAFETVGTSYWGNAVKGVLSTESANTAPVLSFGVYLRSTTRIPNSSETVLYMEMPALFNIARLDGDDSIQFTSLGLRGWHRETSRFNLAFCDGRATDVLLPEGWMSEPPPVGDNGELRRSGVRFDCLPDEPILDRPTRPGRTEGS